MLHYVVSYTLFPSEAYMVERLMHTIFASPTQLRDYIFDVDAAHDELSRLPDQTNSRLPSDTLKTRIARKLTR